MSKDNLLDDSGAGREVLQEGISDSDLSDFDVGQSSDDEYLGLYSSPISDEDSCDSYESYLCTSNLDLGQAAHSTLSPITSTHQSPGPSSDPPSLPSSPASTGLDLDPSGAGREVLQDGTSDSDLSDFDVGQSSDNEYLGLFSSGISDDSCDSYESNLCTANLDLAQAAHSTLSTIASTQQFPGPSGDPPPLPSAPASTDLDLDASDVLVPPPRSVPPPWTRVYAEEPKPDLESMFTCRSPGPKSCPITNEPLDYFKLFMSEGMIILLVRESNIYAQKMIDQRRRAKTLSVFSRLASWVNITIQEMKRFLAIVLYMSSSRMSNVEDYWSSNNMLPTPFCRQYMSLRRFQAISGVLQFSSREGPARGQPGFDPWLKIRPFLNAVNNAFVKHFVAGQNLILGESIIGMRNKKAFIQRHTQHHAGYGIKKFELVDASTMYVVQLALYSGKVFLTKRSVPFTREVVLDLLNSGRCLDKGYHVFTDINHTRLPLAQELLNRKTLLSGIISKSCKGLPKELTAARLDVKEPVYYRQDRILVLGYKEKPTRKPVFLLSTAYQASQQTVLNLCGRERVMINKYNNVMGEVCCKDYSHCNVTCTWAARGYWKKIFYNLLDTCVQNAYIIYLKQTEGMGGTVMPRSKFLIDLIKSLAGEVQNPPTQPSLVKVEETEHELEHLPIVPGGTRSSLRICAVCSKKARFWCPACNCVVHEECYPKLRHFYRPTKSIKRPIEESDSD